MRKYNMNEYRFLEIDKCITLKEYLKDLDPNTEVHLCRAFDNSYKTIKDFLNDKRDEYLGLIKDIPNNYPRLNNLIESAYIDYGRINIAISNAKLKS